MKLVASDMLASRRVVWSGTVWPLCIGYPDCWQRDEIVGRIKAE